GIEAEAAMLGQPTVMLVPEVVGFRLAGRLAPGATATDVVLTVTEMLRKKGVVGKFVEFYGPGVAGLALADRATIGNMAPEYGATIGFFPIDAETLAYLRLSGRDSARVALVEAYARAQGLFRTADTPDPVFSDRLELDLGTVEPSLAGPRRPQDRVPLRAGRGAWRKALAEFLKKEVDGLDRKEVERWLAEGGQPIATAPPAPKALGDLAKTVPIEMGGERGQLGHGAVVIAAITSCTNTSNPSVMLAAGLLARKAVARGLRARPWVKTSLAPGSKVVTRYLADTKLMADLERLGFHLVGYGCTTCIGNSGPLPEAVAAAMRSVEARRFREEYAKVTEGDEHWRAMAVPKGELYAWDPASTYIKSPPFFAGMRREPTPPGDVRGAHALAFLGDSVTTDHISPAGSIAKDSPAGKYLIGLGVAPKDFNSYGARRGNHEVMLRGTFANIRLRNLLVPGVEGGWTVHLPDGERMAIYDAAMRYRDEGVPLVVVAGK